MTEKLNQEALERAAEAGWQEDSLRAHGRKRLIPWSEVDGRDREKWLGLATAIAAALPLSASLAERTRERDEARELAYELKYAAAGGEDVPLSAHAVTVADVNRWRVEAQERADAAEARVKALEGLLGRAVDDALPDDAYADPCMVPDWIGEARAALASSDAARGVDHSSTPLDLASSDAAPESKEDAPSDTPPARKAELWSET